MRDKLNMIYKTMKLAWELDKILIMLMSAGALINAFKPYIPILLGAYILDGLIDGVPSVDMLITAVICFSGLFLLDALQGYMHSIETTRIDTCIIGFNMKMARRTLEMDYQLLESPEVNNLRARIRHDNSWGAGFYSILWQFPWMLGHIFNLIISFVILSGVINDNNQLRHLLPISNS